MTGLMTSWFRFRSSSCVCLWVLLCSAHGIASDLIIEPVGENWKPASITDVKAVLLSSAKPLWKAAGSPEFPVIRVEPSGGPIVLHRRDPDGAIRVRLAVQGRRWAQMAYQFGHEMGHILCRFDEDPDPHHWLEEAACEAISLLTLRKMARHWLEEPPYPNWKPYAEHLQSYAVGVISSASLAETTSFSEWFAENREKLQQQPLPRDLIRVVAVEWLKLMEKQPHALLALTSLNKGTPRAQESLGDALERWRGHCSKQEAKHVTDVARLLGVQLPPVEITAEQR